MNAPMVVGVVAAWVVAGLAVAWVMARRGHRLFTWGLTGAVLGPLTALLALDHLRRLRGQPSRRLQAAPQGGGPVDVLVGIDGSQQSQAALRTALELLGERVGRLTLATVVTYDAALGDHRAPPGALEEREAEASLREAAGELVPGQATLVLLAGTPGDVLAGYARDEGFDLVAVGTRGQGMAQELLGSVAGHLTAQADIAVLVAGE